MATWDSLRQPTVPILLAACVVHVVRRDAVDFAVFFGTAVLIVVDEQRRPSRERRSTDPSGLAPYSGASPDGERAAHPVSAWWRLAGMTFFAALVALAAPASVGARLVLGVIGVAAVLLVLARPLRLLSRRPDRPPMARGWPVWAVIGVAACLWELTSFIAQQVWPLDQDAHPAVSDLVEPLLGTWFGRAVFLLLWAAAGWWLLRQLIGSDRSRGHSEAGR